MRLDWLGRRGPLVSACIRGASAENKCVSGRWWCILPTVNDRSGGIPGIAAGTAIEDLLAKAEHLSRTGRPMSAVTVAEQARDEALALGDTKAYACSLEQLSWYYYMIARYEQGVMHAREAIDIWQNRGDVVHEATSRSYYAWLLCQMGMPGAEQEAMQALRQAETTGDLTALCLAQNTVAVVLWMFKQYDLALDFSLQSIALARRIGEPVVLGRWLINEGGIRGDHAALQASLGDDSLLVAAVGHATRVTEEALALALAHDDYWAARICLGNLAEFALHVGAIDRAAAYMAQWRDLPGELGDRAMIHYHLYTGLVFMAQDRMDEALASLKTGIEYADRVNDLESGVPCCKAIADAYERKGDFRMALQWHRHFHEHYIRYSTHVAQRSARVAAKQYETEQLRSQSENERRRAQALEASNQELAQESDRLKRASEEDPLTGLYNRRALESALATAREGRAPYAIAILDIDHFKRINDGFSHLVGDQVLCRVAAILTNLVRKGDFLARFGGEEFVLLMPGIRSADALPICERLRRSIEEWPWADQAPALRVTVSIGIAGTEGADDPNAILTAADVRLYQAKGNGRNRVEA